ncbi:MAG: substrate-binding domain-containing protein [Candidatus Methanomethyliaceae archaeon]|nr:substrate-binding domain-containing protein [Candidatus Methanomethyliaceae archaeon]
MWRTSKTLSIAILAALIIIGLLAYEQYMVSGRSMVVLATTTSTYDSGLLDYLIPKFKSEYSISVHIVSVGTGQAIEAAKRGDVDLVLVHSRQLELDFINSSYGVHRVGVMYNDFIIIGPLEDPANISGLTNATEALRRIAEEGNKGNTFTLFISRADRSGTHMVELSIWARLGTLPSSATHRWYLEAGGGMGAVMRMANEKRAYTITDRATWISFKSQLPNLRALVQGDLALLNPYAIILTNPEKYPQRNFDGAIALAKWIISEEGQKLIADFKKEGEALFTPIARNYTRAHELGFLDQEEEIAWYDAQKPLS